MDITALFPGYENAVVMGAQVLAILVTLATIISSITPTKSDNAALNRALHLLNLLAGNVAHNKNADDI